MVKASSILLISNWDIEDALIFNSIADKMSLEDQGKKETKGAKFSED